MARDLSILVKTILDMATGQMPPEPTTRSGAGLNQCPPPATNCICLRASVILAYGALKNYD